MGNYEGYFGWLESHPMPISNDPLDKQRWTKSMAWDYNHDKRCPYVKYYYVHSGGDNYFVKRSDWWIHNRKYWNNYHSHQKLFRGNLSEKTLDLFDRIVNFGGKYKVQPVTEKERESTKKYMESAIKNYKDAMRKVNENCATTLSSSR